MSRIVNGVVSIPSFNPTGNPGEYTIAGAQFSSQSDTSGSGAYLVAVGFVVYVPASDPNTLLEIPGVIHRYRLTAVNVTDVGTFDGTVIWDEEGDELDTPTNGATCIISATTPNRALGLPVDPMLYTSLPAGAATSAYNVDTEDILDKSIGGGSYKFVQASPATQWNVTHNQDSTDYLFTLFDQDGVQVIPDAIIAVSANEIQVNVLQAMAGKLVLLFIA